MTWVTAVIRIQSLAWELLHATGTAKKKHFHTVTCFFFFLGLHLWHMQVPRLGVELETPSLGTATATQLHLHTPKLVATWDP